jgi:hypothetical protein
MMTTFRHCEERSDAAISSFNYRLLRFARNDKQGMNQ